MTDMETLGTALPAEMARVRDQVLPAYDACGPDNAFAAALIRMDLDAARKARAYQQLKDWTT